MVAASGFVFWIFKSRQVKSGLKRLLLSQLLSACQALAGHHWGQVIERDKTIGEQ